jgi:tetratricopeptide (TPR) repeat protein
MRTRSWFASVPIQTYILWLGEGDIPRAEREFLQAIDLNPNCAQAHEWYADLLVHTGRVQEACRQSEDALALDPLSSPLVQIYAQSLHAAGRLDEAVVQYRKALEMNPELEGAWWGLWYSLAAAWDWDRAEALTREIIKEHPGNPFAYVNLATCVMCRGRLEEGLVEIRKALQLAGDPKRASIVVHVGHCHYFARKFDEAIEHYRWVLEGNPTWNYVHNMIAKCYILQMRYDEALDELEASERVFGGADPFWNTHVHMDRGKIYARRGETDKARRELEILMRSSGRLNRHIAIAGVLSALGEVDEAMDWLDAAATAREPHVAALRKSPELDPLRSHPRYQALLKRIGLAD